MGDEKKQRVMDNKGKGKRIDRIREVTERKQ